jgi:Ca2+-binding RTX toxin-like protein
MGSASPTEFVGGSGKTDMIGGSGSDTYIAGSGNDTMDATGSHNVFKFLSTVPGGTHVIDNFVSTDQLIIQNYGARGGSIATGIVDGQHSTIITLDGGHTKIELVGVTHFNPSEIKH